MGSYNQNLAEFVGILLGDGFLEFSPNKHYEVKISLDKIKDREYVGFVQKLIFNLFEINANAYDRSSDGTVDIRIARKRLVQYLIQNVGLVPSPKHGRVKIPDNLFLSQHYIPILRGYFDTDGCIVDTNNNGTRYPRIGMKVCKSPMQKQFIHMLYTMKFRFGTYTIENEAIRIQMNGKHQLKKWMNMIGSNNPRNIEKAKRFLRKNNSGGWI